MSPVRKGSLLVAAGAVGVLFAAGRTWAEAYFDRGAILGRAVVDVTGREMTELPTMLALLALAGVGGLIATRGGLRIAVGVVVALAGAGVVISAAQVLTDPRHHVAGASLDRPGLAAAVPDVATTTVWPWVCAAAGALVVTGALIALRPAHGSTARPAPVEWHRDPWAVLSAGGDPTDVELSAGGDPTDGDLSAGGDPTDGDLSAGGDPTDGDLSAGGDPTDGDLSAGGDPTDVAR